MTWLKSFVIVLFCSLAIGARGARADEMPQSLVDAYAKAYVQNWVWFGGGFHQDYYYLPLTIRTTPRGTKTVWGVNLQAADSTDWFSSRPGVVKQRELAHLSAEKYSTYLLSKVQWEIDCVHQRARILQILDYDEEGNLIWSARLTGKLEDPVPDSNGEGLLKASCNPRHRVYFRDMLIGKPPK